MSKAHVQAITCPNCGSKSSGNFCSQCGQSNHLHRETFWSLITHFFAHYLHYDSKFWQTLKALWFSPGKLTLAYWKDQRMRYVAPVALYIFISTVFFLVTFVSPVKLFEAVKLGFDFPNLDDATIVKMEAKKFESFLNFINYKLVKFGAEQQKPSDYLLNKFVQSFVKIFFFMIPIMGLLLKLIYYKRKDLLFVDHAVFSLHYHSFWFSIFIFFYLIPCSDPYHHQLVIGALFIITGLYLLLAIKNVYQPGWLKSVFATLVISVSYAVLLGIFALIYVALIVILN